MLCTTAEPAAAHHPMWPTSRNFKWIHHLSTSAFWKRRVTMACYSPPIWADNLFFFFRKTHSFQGKLAIVQPLKFWAKVLSPSSWKKPCMGMPKHTIFLCNFCLVLYILHLVMSPCPAFLRLADLNSHLNLVFKQHLNLLNPAPII